MANRLLPCLAGCLALAACGPGQPKTSVPASGTTSIAPAAAGRTVVYQCGAGRTLTATYEGDKATILWGDQRHEMKIARSASGARYVGGGLQWWTRGTGEASLAKLQIGELIASDPGIACTPGKSRGAVEPPPPGSPGGLPKDGAPVSEAPFTPESAQGAASVVQTYYAQLEAGAYDRAWKVWGDGGKASGQGSAGGFAHGFDRYSEYHAQIGAPGKIEGAAGSLYVSVPVVIYGRLKSGAEVHEKGEAQLRRVNDVPGSTAEQRRWHIVKIETTPTG